MKHTHIICTGNGLWAIAWDSSLRELRAYARQCCVIRRLTPEERAQFGLPPVGE